jgi:alanine dehydrogenase
LVEILSSTEVLARIGMRDAIAAVERTLIAFANGEVGPPGTLGVAAESGSFHVKACASAGGLFVAKVNSNFPENGARHALPTIQGVVAVFDAENGRLRALLDSPSITGLRTAATTAVVIRRLAAKEARVATVIGCGELGRFHLQALAECGFDRIHLHDIDAARACEVGAWATKSLGLECVPASDLRTATLASQVVVTCTSSRVPILGSGDVRPGTLVAAVGADSERKSEIAASLLGEARIVADLRSQCLKIGDLRNAVPNEAFVCGELADVVAGRVARTSADEIVVFDSTGLAVQDLALCSLLVH